MGCAICKGFSYQVCNAPGCKAPHRNVYGGLEDISNTSTAGWGELPPPPPPPACDLCNKPAVWAHPQGGLRCDACPKPSK